MAKKTAAPPKAARTRTTIQRNGLGVSARIDVAPDDPTRNTNIENVLVFTNQALRRFKMAADAESYNRAEGLTDLLMVDGDGQWDGDVREIRKRKKRPCLTINRFIPMISHVANEMRAARPTIQVEPTGGGADVSAASVRQGLIRHIEHDSNAETVYDNAFDSMLEKGWSWFRVRSDYENEESHDQVLKIEGFENDFCVYVDPTAKDPTRKDMNWAFIVEDMPIGEYCDTYPDSQVASLTNFASVGDDAADWLGPNHVRVAEYFYVEREKATLYQLKDGSGYWKDKLQEVNGMYVDKELFQRSERGEIDPEMVPLVDVAMDDDGKPVQRESFRRKVKWCKINAREILEGNDEQTEGRDWKGKYIPLVMVQGRLKNIKGQRRLAGMVRNNRDAQRMYNYWVTAFTEMVALAPKSPWVIAAGQVEKYKEIWDTANDEAWPYLPYDPVNINGQFVPAPSRQTFEPPVQAMIQAIRQADNDIKLGFNIFDASLGQKGPQESGKAILARKNESESGNLNWLDNMKKAIQHCGDVLLDLLPTRYDTARVVAIVRPDNSREMVAINQDFADQKTGETKHYDMASGKFSCTVQVGAGDGTKRQEAVEAMMQLVTAEPQLFNVIGDLIVAEMDWPGADAIVERLKKALPPNLQDSDGKGNIPPEVAATIQKGQVLIQTLEQRLQGLEDEKRTKLLELESKERIAGRGDQTQIITAEIAASVKREVAGLEGQIKAMENMLNVWVQQQSTAAAPAGAQATA